jgi:hypothetical protein
MNAIEVAQNQFNAWNRHDADALVAAYGKEGTYRTPRVDHDLSGQASATLLNRFGRPFLTHRSR